jgi:hypothetical protein
MESGIQPRGTAAAGREPAPIGSLLTPFQRYLKGSRLGLLAAQEALRAVLPEEPAGWVRVEGLCDGVLTLSAPDAAAKCLLEAILRGGAFEALREAMPQVPLRRARVVLA